MISIKNTQRTVRIDRARLTADVQKLLAELDYQNFDVGIWLTTDRTIRAYNRKYRHKDEPTNILSFPYHRNANPKSRIAAATDEEKNLGDMIISAAYAQREAAQLNRPFIEHLRVLVVHGICHLIGYEHETDTQYRAMQTAEKQLLKLLV